MKTIKLKTNIMCGSCVANANQTLNELIGSSNWKVDTANPNKILTVTTETMSEAEVIKAVQQAGYKAEKAL